MKLRTGLNISSWRCLLHGPQPAPPLRATTKGRRARSRWRPSGSLWQPWPSSCRAHRWAPRLGSVRSEFRVGDTFPRRRKHDWTLLILFQFLPSAFPSPTREFKVSHEELTRRECFLRLGTCKSCRENRNARWCTCVHAFIQSYTRVCTSSWAER